MARLIKGPYEIYFNEHTMKYHMIQYKDRLKNGARTCKVLGRFDSFEAAEASLAARIKEALYSE